MMRMTNIGEVTQCTTLSHLFQLWSSSFLSTTGTVRDRKKLAGL